MSEGGVIKINTGDIQSGVIKMTTGHLQGGLSKLKKKHFRVKHQKVKLFRANETILSVFMWGVNHTVC